MRVVKKLKNCFWNCWSSFNGQSVIAIVAAQLSVHPTGGTLRVFELFSGLELGSGKVVLSRPAHQRVTLTVGQMQAGHDEGKECENLGS